ncbi:MAG TPA: non-ribosomal peptide synthetase, partial [Thermoanaerobaculia bacterium]
MRALGVGIGGVETRIGVCVERSVDLPVVLLGILKAGGAYVPLDSAYPAERLRLLIEDSGASLILTEEALLDRLPSQGPRRICLEQLAATPDGDGIATCAAVSPDNLAYVLYTSGSTGRPKGVQITHRAVVSFLRSMARRPGMTAGDTLLAVTTLCFDIAGLELYLPLLVGARVVLASRATASDPGRLAAALATSQATMMQATPATWRMLSASGWSPAPRLTILCGGEALPPELAAGLTAGGAALWNLYGPTETTIWSSVHPVQQVSEPGGPLPIGRPIDNTALHVLDPLDGGEMVPVGWEGELGIAGVGLSRGYLGQPDRTAERFVPDPWGAPGARLYRTGDRVRRLADGTIQYLGRADGQIKVRGFRIEPGEVEAHLVRHPAVAAAVVDAPAANGSERRLTAWLVAKTALPSAGELRAFLLERLPEPMVPSLFVPIERLPLTPNGKVDRRALPAPDGTRPDLVAAYAPPQGGAEEALVRIWERVLGLDRVGRDDNFFEAGGDSIRALQVVFQARREGLDLAPGDLFLHRTPAELAAAAGRRKAVRPEEEAPWCHPAGSLGDSKDLGGRNLPSPQILPARG